MPYASVYPLLSTRSLSRPFSYEVGDEISKGSIVAMRFAGRSARGIVAALEEGPPDGIAASPVDGLLGSVSPELVDLALWIADYYGSTPARALALVAPEFSPPPRPADSPLRAALLPR